MRIPSNQLGDSFPFAPSLKYVLYFEAIEVLSLFLHSTLSTLRTHDHGGFLAGLEESSYSVLTVPNGRNLRELLLGPRSDGLQNATVGDLPNPIVEWRFGWG